MPLTDEVWDDFKLKQGTREPGALRISEDASAAVLNGIVTPEVLEEILTRGIETAESDNTTGRLLRTNPIAHPDFKSLYVRSIDNIQGIGFVDKEVSDPYGELEIPAIPYKSTYQKYEVQATFEGRPYVMLDDDSIPSASLTYYTISGTPVTRTIWNEWYRNVVWERDPAAEYLTADLGEYRFSVTGAPATGNPVDLASAGKGQIRQLIPSSTWRAIWYGVPYQYVLSSNTYFDRLQGHVNKNEWEGFTPGEALLQAVRVLKVYSPPLPTFESYGGFNIPSPAKLCNLQFDFHAVKRTPTTAVTPTNLNHVAAGHNCIYWGSWASGRTHYVENFRTGAAGTGVPVYPSTAFELLFQNPDWTP